MFDVDLNVVRAVLLVVLFIAFLGMWAWAWSSRRSADFGSASRLPLEEDQDTNSSGQSAHNSTPNSTHSRTEA